MHESWHTGMGSSSSCGCWETRCHNCNTGQSYKCERHQDEADAAEAERTRAEFEAHPENFVHLL